MHYLRTPVTAIILATLLFSGCENSVFRPEPPAQPGLAAVPAVRLNYRYEADVPAPMLGPEGGTAAVRNPAVQADFDANRPAELLDRTLTSPDEKSVLAIYQRLSDPADEYRLDMYLPDGKVLRQITPDSMSVSWPEAIGWSPDSSSVAFAAKTRTTRPVDTEEPGGLAPAAAAIPESEVLGSDVPGTASPEPTPSPTPPPAAANVLTFATEQIYTCGADGTALRALTTNDGLKYFYFAWSPDSTMLASLAITAREYEAFEPRPAQATPTPKPKTPEPPLPLTVRPSAGRLRIVERNGRERRLDDARTGVKPVWSPDSTKVAAAFSLSTQPADPKLTPIFDAQVRIYDASPTNPTQAAIPLRLPLLLSSHAYDRGQTGQQQPTQEQPLTTVPEIRDLRSLGPISELAWNAEDILYFKTTLTPQKIGDTEAPLGFSRWHRLVLSTQPIPTATK